MHDPERFTFRLNGAQQTVQAEGGTPLLDVLRNRLGLKGTRFGCGTEGCGACFVVIDGNAVASCALPLSAVDGKSVTTIEGLGRPDAPHRLQQAFIAEQAAQCGYCTAGMVVTALALLANTPRPSEQQVREALAGNLCRCGSHARVIRAVLKVAGTTPGGAR
jgi:nicotinate dehydrogenase subunit A